MATHDVTQIANLRHPFMLKVGLTGSIAVGKSFVLDILRELGARTIDADAVAREVVEPGKAGLNSVVNEFGAEILRPDGSLNRPALGSIVFADEAKRQKLNSILHPFIIARQDEIMRQCEKETPDAIAVVDAALMIESGGYKRFDKLIVVHCRTQVQLERLMKRDNISRAEAERRINAQMPQEEKKKHSDYLIDTSEGFESARQQTIVVWQELRSLSGSPS
ncbi:MAG: dephospho-CoA kinase [Acidobacteriota bacterium]